MALIIEDTKDVTKKSIPIPNNAKQIFKALAKMYEPYLNTTEGGKILKSYASDKTYNKKSVGNEDENGKEASNNRVPVDVAKMRLSRQNDLSPNSIEYQLYGGQLAHNILQKGVESARATEKVGKVKPPKPTAVPKPRNADNTLKPIKTPKGNITIKEAWEVGNDYAFEGYHPYYDYKEAYGPQAVINNFMSSRDKEWSLPWKPFIRPTSYEKALKEFTRYGMFMTFPGDMVYQWMGIIMKNTALLRACTELAGHTQYFPDIELIEPLNNWFGYEKCVGQDNDNVSLILTHQNVDDIIDSKQNYSFCSENIFTEDRSAGSLTDMLRVWKTFSDILQEWAKDNYCEINFDSKSGQIIAIYPISELLDAIGFWDKCVIPDGSDAISDYGLEPLEKIIHEYDKSQSPEEVLVLVNRALDIAHMRGDLASMFIEGGSRTLWRISEEVNKKTIIIPENRVHLLKEYYDQTRFNFDQEGNGYFKKDSYQLYIDFLESIGTYGSLPASKESKDSVIQNVENLIPETIANTDFDDDSEVQDEIALKFIVSAIISDTVSGMIRQPLAWEIQQLVEMHPDYDEDDWNKSEELRNIISEYGVREGHATDIGQEYYRKEYVQYHRSDLDYYGFPDNLTFDKRGLIYIEREISIPQLDWHGKVNDDSDFYKLLSKSYDGVGNCWSWKINGSEAYCGYSEYEMVGQKQSYLVLEGYVDPQTVDWKESISRNAYSPEEKELYIPNGGYVEIDYIRARGIMHGNKVSNVTILNKPIIVPVG